MNRHSVPTGGIIYDIAKHEKDKEYYEIKITDENTYSALQRLYIIGYKTGKKGNRYKEKIGIDIAIDFLENVLNMDVIDNPAEEFSFKERYGLKVYPDLIASSKGERDIVEVKFLSYPRMIERRIRMAEKELNRQIDKLQRANLITKLNITHKTIIIVVYNFKATVNKGILLIKRDKI